MGSLAAIQMLVSESFSELCNKENHRNRVKRVLRVRSCDTVCTRCTYDDEPTIEVVKFRNRNCVWVDDINDKVDASGIQKEEADDGKELIRLQAYHMEYNCDSDNFCSLACKIDNVRAQFGTLSSIDMMNLRVTKKRTGGRRKRISWTMGVVEGHLPPKKRANRGG